MIGCELRVIGSSSGRQEAPRLARARSHRGQGASRLGRRDHPQAVLAIVPNERRCPSEGREYREGLDLVRDGAQQRRRPRYPRVVGLVADAVAGASHLVPQFARYQAAGRVESSSAIGGEEVGRRGRHRFRSVVIIRNYVW